jgi:hypothetical protein
VKHLVIELINNTLSLLAGAHLDESSSLRLAVLEVQELGSLGLEVLVLQEEHQILLINSEAQVGDVEGGTFGVLRGGLLLRVLVL